MVKKERSPESRADKLKAAVDLLRKKVNTSKDDVERRRAYRRLLKRTQRKLARTRTLTLEEELARTDKLLEMNAKGQDVQKQKGKTPIHPRYHSLSKKAKSLNKKVRKLKRRQEKIKKAEEKAAKARAAAEQPAAAVEASETPAES
jgi:hypothetical protein